MYKLNLPEYDFMLKRAEGKVWIFDGIRKKYIVLTPEEWVRQHFIQYLITEKKYPRTLIRVEGGVVYNDLKKRSDIVVYNREGTPWMVVECKSPTFRMSASVLSQVSMYNATLRAPYVCVTNGLIHLWAHTDWERMTTIPIPDTPPFPAE